MDKNSRIVIVGAGVFGLSTALELSTRGFRNIIVLDRHVPPVPDGSSVDISRIIRFDYADPIYTRIAKEAYNLWSTSPLYKSRFFKQPFILCTSQSSGRAYINKCTENLDLLSLPWKRLQTANEVKTEFSTLTGALATTNFYGYTNPQAGWADAAQAIADLRDRCIEAGISFFSGAHGTVIELLKEGSSQTIIAAKVKSGDIVRGDFFILATGAWTSQLVPMYNSILATAQVLGFVKLTDDEQRTYDRLPIYINFDSGWFCFPTHKESGYLKIAVHGRGYTRSRQGFTYENISALSSPPIESRSRRKNYAPNDGVERLREGLKAVLPELANREFDRTAVCWYTDTPTGDFIMDYHPDYENLFLATGGSGHAFKFLPVLGKYIANGIERSLPNELHMKWRFRQEYDGKNDTFKGDGSRGGPSRREFTLEEKARL